MSDCTGPTCSTLGKLHKWWLREFGPHTKLMVGYVGYAGTPYGKAIIGLMNRGLVEFDTGFGDMVLIRLTPEGSRVKSSLSNVKGERHE